MLEISDQEEIRNIDQKIRKVLGPGPLPEYTVEPIPSGVPILLLYERGVLTRGLKRGDPSGSENVTRNVKTILAVPLSIHSILAGKEPPGRLEVWGVVYIEKDAVKPDGAYGSMRDMVSASLVEADVRVTARRSLNMFCYGAEQELELSGHIGADSHFEVMQMLQHWGFRVNKPHIRLCSGISKVIEAIRTIEEQRGGSPYEINGVLVQVNALAKRAAIEELLGREIIIEYDFKVSKEES